MRSPLPRIIAALSVLLLPLQAAAVTGSPDARPSPLLTQGPEERVYARNDDVQAQLRAQAPYQDFLQRYGGTWEVQFDEVLGTPIWMRGSGIPLIPSWRTATRAEVLAISQQFLRENAALFQASVKELQPLSVDFYSDIWVVYFERRHGGIPVLGSSVELVFKFGRLVLVNGESYPVKHVSDGAFRVNVAAEEAARLVRDELTLGGAEPGDAHRQVVYPIVRESAVDYRLAWETTHRRTDAAGITTALYVSYVDAATGKILEIQDGIKHQFTGNVTSRVDTRTVNDPIITIPNRDNRVNVGASTGYTDASGNWSISGSGTQTLTLNLIGRHANVQNSAGTEMTITHAVTAGTPSNDLFNASAVTDLSQTGTYRSVQATNEMLRQEYTGNNWLNNTVVRANVNISGSCNAYWDGSTLNMYAAGGSCNNMGRIFDVVAHEYGHGADQNLPGGASDGGLGEFIGDLQAFVQTDDDRIGPYFYNSGGPVRDLNPSSFPCYSSSVTEVHDQGEMLGAVIWDIWTDLKPLMVRSELQRLMVRPIGTSQTRSSWYNGLLVADDDDGNLANGTPHACIIWAQYDAHSCGSQRWPTVPAAPGPPCSNSAPTADFSGTPTSGTAPLTVNFTDLSFGAPTSWSWTFGDGGTSTAQNPSHVYAAAGTYDVSLTATNGNGSDTETKNGYITVSAPAPPTADFSGTPLSGPAPLSVQFTDLTTGSVTSWSWTFGDGGTSTAQNPSHVYAAAGSYTVSLTSTGPLGSDVETKVNYVQVQPSIFCDNFDSGAPGWTHQGSPDEWVNGTPTGANNDPSAAYSAPNEYGTDHGAGDSMYEPDETTSLSSPAINCTGYTGVKLNYKRWLAVEDAFYDQATIYVNGTQVWQNANGGGNQHHLDSAWTTHEIDISAIADNNPSVVVRYEIVSDGGLEFGGWNIDDFCLFGTGGGGSAPVADFSGSPLTGTAPLTVNFLDASSNSPTSWSWSFGDGGTSTSQNPSHVYGAAGSYTVALTATNASGSDTETKVNYVTVTGTGSFTSEEIVSGAGPGPSNAPVVKTWNHATPPAQQSSWQAYGAPNYGANVASVDMVGGGTHEVATGPGPGGNYGPQIRGFQAGGASISKVNFYAYSTLRYGAHPGGGDVDGDGHGELLTTPGPGAVFGPHVRGWNYDGATLGAIGKVSFFAYSTLRYGARAAGGDTDADGVAEIITGAGAGAVFTSHVRGFNYDNVAVAATFSFFAFPTGQYGACVAAGNTDVDGRTEVIASHGPDPSANAEVKGFEHNGGVANQWSITTIAGALGGAEVAAGDLDADGQDELVTATGWGAANASRIVGHEIVGTGGTAISGLDYDPYGQTYGAKVAVGDIGI